MLKKQLKNTKLKSELKNFLKKNRNILLDVIIFGSLIKGNEKPNDIDVLILYKDKKDLDKEYELKKLLEKKGFDVDLNSKNYKELFNETFKAREGVLAEGFSILNNNFLSASFGYVSFNLFKYELRGFTKSNRMRFYYSLYGRNKNEGGILKDLNAFKFSDTILLCPIQNTEKMKEYFDYWKIKYIEFPIMMPDRLKNLIQRNT